MTHQGSKLEQGWSYESNCSKLLHLTPLSRGLHLLDRTSLHTSLNWRARALVSCMNALRSRAWRNGWLGARAGLVGS